MATVTVPGGSGNPPITYTYSSVAGLTVAQQIANAFAAAGSLSVTSSSSGGAISVPGSGGPNELILSGSTSSTVPAGYQYIANTASGPATIQASGGSAIISSIGGGTFTETGPATIAAA